MNLDALRVQLIKHEGLVLFPYTDTTGHLTIGCGRNLSGCGISKAEALSMLDRDIDRHVKELQTALPWVTRLDDVRQRVLYDMAFNLGVPGLLKFRNTLKVVESGDYVRAADMMLKTLWAQQVKGRAQTLARMMGTGKDV